jgi:hypothetical protein
MREAYNCALADRAYYDDYSMTLLAVRQQDQTPEEHYMMRFDAHNPFRNEYAFMRSRVPDVIPLEERIREVLREGQQQQRSRAGWAYSDVTPPIVELPATQIDVGSRTQAYELQERDHRASVAKEILQLDTETGDKRVTWNWR